MQGIDSTPSREFVLTLSCRDTKGIVHGVSGLLYQAGCNILDSQQFGDVHGEDATGLFFMRVHFEAPADLADVGTLHKLFGHVRGQFQMEVALHAMSERSRLLLLVSQHGHCLNDLLFRWKSGQLPVDIPAIVSNHPDFADLAASYGLPFHHLPLAGGSSAETKRARGTAESLAKEIPANVEVDPMTKEILRRREGAERAGVARHDAVAWGYARAANALGVDIIQNCAVTGIRRDAAGGWFGDMCDGEGYVAGLRKEGCDLQGKRALLVGAGGAGSAIAHALVDAGVASLALHEADVPRREALAAKLRAYGAVVPTVGSTDASAFDLVINATPMGMKEGDPLPVNAATLQAGTFVGCVVTKPAVPPLIEQARARGLPTMTGAGMFAAVLERMIAFYTEGKQPSLPSHA